MLTREFLELSGAGAESPAPDGHGLYIKALDEDGSGLKSARVLIRPSSYTDSDRSRTNSDSSELYFVADSNGVSWIPGGNAMDFHVSVSSTDGFVERFIRESETAAGQVVELVVPRFVDVEVKVVASNGIVLPHIPVSLSYAAHRIEFTDEHGIAHISAPILRRYRNSIRPILQLFHKSIRGDVISLQEFGISRVDVEIEDVSGLDLRIVDPASGLESPGLYRVEIFAKENGRGATERSSYHVSGPRLQVAGAELGGDVLLRVSEPGGLPVLQRITIPRDRETQIVRIEKLPRAAVLVVPLYSSDGVLMAGSKFRYSIEYDSKPEIDPLLPRTKNEIVADGSGRLHLEIMSGCAGKIKLFAQQGLPNWSKAAKPLFSAGFGSLAPGVVFDFPAVELEQGLYVGGFVRDQNGSPVEGAQVRLSFPYDEAEYRAAVVSSDKEIYALSKIRMFTNAEGRFVFFSNSYLKGAMAFASNNQARSSEVSFVSGEDELDLVLIQTGGFRGSLPHDECHSYLGATIEYCAREALGRAPDLLTPLRGKASIDSNGEFVVDGLIPGVYDVALVVNFQRIWEVEGIKVRAGEIADEPRLNPKQIAALQKQVVTVFGRDGVAAAGARVRFRRVDYDVRPDRPWFVRSICDANGRAEAMAGENWVFDIEVKFRGEPVQEFHDRKLPSTIILGEGAELGLSILLAGRKPDDSYLGFVVGLTRIRDSSGWSTGINERAKLMNQNVVFENIEPGRYGVTLQLERGVPDFFQDSDLRMAVTGMPKFILGELLITETTHQQASFSFSIEEQYSKLLPALNGAR